MINQYVATYVAHGFILNVIILNDLDYEYLKSNDETWYCKTCIQEILPFCNKKINPNKINLGNAGIDPNLKNLLCQLNNLSEKENIDNENLPNCKYIDTYVIFPILMMIFPSSNQNAFYFSSQYKFTVKKF